MPIKQIVTCDKCNKEVTEYNGYYNIIPNFACDQPGCLVLHIWPKEQILCSECYKK